MIETIVILVVVFFVGRWLLYRTEDLVFGRGRNKSSGCYSCGGSYRQPTKAIGPGNYVRDHSYPMYCPGCGMKG